MTVPANTPVALQTTGLGLCLVLAALSGCSNGQGPEKMDLQLTIASHDSITTQEMKRAGGKLTSIGLSSDGVHCIGGGGFSQFTPDSFVEVLDEQGNRLGFSPLGLGTLERAGLDIEGQPLFNKCHFQTSIPLNGQARIYQLHIGGESFVRRFHVTQLQKLKGRVVLKVD